MLDRLFSFADPRAGVYAAVALEGETASAVVAGALEEPVRLENARATRGEGTLRLEGADATLVLGLVARTTPLAFETAPDRSVQLQSIGGSGALVTPGGEENGFEADGVAWALSGEADQRSLRALWALSERGLFAMFALRESDATEHGSETVGAVRIEGDGSVVAWDEPLLSTEYDERGRQTRATLELWGSEEDALADRGGGTRVSGGDAALGEGRLEAAGFGWSLGGTPAYGSYEIYTA